MSSSCVFGEDLMTTRRVRTSLVVAMGLLVSWWHVSHAAGPPAVAEPGTEVAGAATFDVASALRPIDTADPERHQAEWVALLAVHGLSVAADLVTTRRAFEHGAVEANPLYS